MRVVKSFEKSGLLVKGISETIKGNRAKRSIPSNAIKSISC